MAKLTKDQTQKVMLSLLMLIVFIVVYNVMLLKPLNQRMAASSKAIGDLRANVEKADQQLLKIKNLRADSVKATETLAYLEGNIPDAAPIAWFPQKIGEFFARYAIDGVNTRQTGLHDLAKDNFGKRSVLDWSIDIPKAEYIPMGIAIAALENEEPLMEINSFNITASDQNPKFQTIQINASIILKQ